MTVAHATFGRRVETDYTPREFALGAGAAAFAAGRPRAVPFERLPATMPSAARQYLMRRWLDEWDAANVRTAPPEADFLGPQGQAVTKACP